MAFHHLLSAVAEDVHGAQGLGILFPLQRGQPPEVLHLWWGDATHESARLIQSGPLSLVSGISLLPRPQVASKNNHIETEPLKPLSLHHPLITRLGQFKQNVF